MEASPKLSFLSPLLPGNSNLLALLGLLVRITRPTSLTVLLTGQLRSRFSIMIAYYYNRNGEEVSSCNSDNNTLQHNSTGQTTPNSCDSSCLLACFIHHLASTIHIIRAKHPKRLDVANMRSCTG